MLLDRDTRRSQHTRVSEVITRRSAHCSLLRTHKPGSPPSMLGPCSVAAGDRSSIHYPTAQNPASLSPRTRTQYLQIPNFSAPECPSRTYRIPDALRPQLQKTIEDLAAHGLIEVQSDSPYNSPILFATKPNSTEMRFCFDSRELNKVLLDHPYPAPTTEEHRVARLQHDARLAGVEAPLWFSKTDTRHGYWQIEVHPDDRPLLAFTVPVLDCSYQWCVMPMGTKSSAAIFQHAMDQVLAPFSSFFTPIGSRCATWTRPAPTARLRSRQRPWDRCGVLRLQSIG
jgi:hypothetical protein